LDNRKLVVLEIGTSAVKKIEARLENATFFWDRAELVELRAKDEETRKKEIQAAVEEISRGGAGGGTEVVYAFNSPQSFVRELLLPKIPQKELEQAIQIQLKKELPFPPEEASIGFQISEVRRPEEGGRVSVVASAVSKKALDQELGYLKQSGWEPQDVVHTPFSARRFSVLAGLPAGDVVALIDLGASFTELNIYENFRLRFARKINIGGRDITESLANPQSLERAGLPAMEPPAVEALKRKRGLIPSHPEDGVYPDFQPMQFLSIARPHLEAIQNEVLRSFNYFAEQFHGKTVKQVYLLGGGALLKGLREFLEKRLQVPVSPLTLADSESLRVSEEVRAKGEDAARYHRMLLAVSSFLEEHKAKPFLKRIPPARLIQIGAGAFALLALVLFVNFWMLDRSLKKYDQRWQELFAPFETAKRVKDVENELVDRRNRFNEFFSREPYWEDLYRELTNVIPENFLLDRIDFDNGKLSLSGAYTQNVTGGDVLATLLAALSKGIVKKANLVSTKEVDKKQGVFQFEITCNL
jgi:type IV pilus assembly protein PilM